MSTIRRPPTRAADPASVLFGQTRRRILGWLFGHPDRAFYLREIVRRTGAAHGAVQRDLALLVGAGLLRRSVRGREVFFQANRESPVFPELLSLMTKTAGLVDVLRDALEPLSDRIRVAFVFGSAARGELRPESDIDLLVVGETSFPEIVDAVVAAQQRIGRDVNPTVYPEREFRAKLRAGHHFVTSVLGEPHLYVVGGVDELGRVGAQRLADGARDESKRDPRPPRGRRARSRG